MSTLFERIALLKRSPVFCEVSTEDLRTVAQVLEEEVYASGERIFDKDEQGDHMYILQSGKVGISINDDMKQGDYLAELGAGETFGEMNLLDNLPRSATAYVISDAIVLSLEKSKLHRLIGRYPELGLGIMQGLSLRLRAANVHGEQ